MNRSCFETKHVIFNATYDLSLLIVLRDIGVFVQPEDLRHRDNGQGSNVRDATLVTGIGRHVIYSAR